MTKFSSMSTYRPSPRGKISTRSATQPIFEVLREPEPQPSQAGPLGQALIKRQSEGLRKIPRRNFNNQYFLDMALSKCSEMELNQAREEIELMSAAAIATGIMQGRQLDITPPYIAALLERNARNRQITRRKVARAMAIIDSGAWIPNSQGFSVASDGLLNNGQTRIVASLLTGKMITTFVVFNEDPAAFPILDTQNKRTGQDVTYMRGDRTGATDTVIRFIMTADDPPSVRREVTNQETDRFLSDFPLVQEAADRGAEFSSKPFRNTKSLRGGAGMAYYFIRSKHSDRKTLLVLEEFWTTVATANTTPDDPRTVLREAILSGTIKDNGGMRGRFVGATIIKAWNAWMDGRGVTLADIAYNWRSEEFPKPS